jgi:hypothetical protein
MLTLAELIPPHLNQGLLADKLLVLKFLAANPWFSRFYAGYFKLCRRNPSLLKVLGDDIVFLLIPISSSPRPNSKSRRPGKLKSLVG